MKCTTLFKKYLKQAEAKGLDHNQIKYLAGCTERKLTLTEAEVEAAKQTWQQFMGGKMWHDNDFGESWMFGSPETQLNIGMLPLKLAHQRLSWTKLPKNCYIQVY